ncbi:MAG TPA: hypothetical protein VNO33_10100 [Kofleriaceae bacterium]|nr:hypothetical protein [Kofleriaceae bacterium]
MSRSVRVAQVAALAALAALAASCGRAGAGQGGGGGNQGAGTAALAEEDGADRSDGRAPRRRVARAEEASRAPVSWLKGSTHVHTAHSGDSRVPVEDVAEWYGERGYDFIVVTDHNRVTSYSGNGRPLVLQGIELTHNPGSCDPPPPEPDGKCRIHLNGLGLGVAALERTATAPAPAVIDALDGNRPPAIEWKNQGSSARVDMYQAGIDKVRQLGGLVQINHPNWHWGVDGRLLAELGRRGATLVEVANMGFARWNTGDANHPAAEAVWDAALSDGVLIYGVASDDAHDYDESEIAAKRAAGRPVYEAGTGWVMVRAARRPDSIRRALERGDFYASTGVLLDRLELASGSIQIEVAGGSPGEHEITFIGQGGAVLERRSARSARFPLAQAPAGYVRAVVTRDDGARAWVQPVRVPAVAP